VSLWEAIASRYVEMPEVAAFNIMNEPSDVTGEHIGPLYDRIHDAIRAIDPNHIIIFDGNRGGVQFDVFDTVWPNSVWSVHDYSDAGFADAGPYPGVSRGVLIDRGSLEQTFLERTRFMRENDVPAWVGEFGPYYTGAPDVDQARYQLLRDQLEIYDRYGVGWSLWSYKDIGLQGLVSAAADSSYVRRIQTVIAKKTKLGVDEWGTTDAHVRGVIAPIEALLDAEVPVGLERRGERTWLINRLVRHELFAESLVEEFGACFQGLGREEPEELADSFRLDRCVPRSELLSILAATALAEPDGH
jgi:hypothetical protein